MLHPQNPPNPETQIPQHSFKLNPLLCLFVYREHPRNRSFSIWWLAGCSTFSAKCHTPTYHSLSTQTHLTPTYGTQWIIYTYIYMCDIVHQHIWHQRVGTHDILHKHVWHQLMAHRAFYVCVYIYICGIILCVCIYIYMWHSTSTHLTSIYGTRSELYIYIHKYMCHSTPTHLTPICGTHHILHQHF